MDVNGYCCASGQILSGGYCTGSPPLLEAGAYNPATDPSLLAAAAAAPVSSFPWWGWLLAAGAVWFVVVKH